MLYVQGVKIVAAMCVVRNSVGENSYVADEIITSRAGVRLRSAPFSIPNRFNHCCGSGPGTSVVVRIRNKFLKGAFSQTKQGILRQLHIVHIFLEYGNLFRITIFATLFVGSSVR
jgi:hypothetical protein